MTRGRIIAAVVVAAVVAVALLLGLSAEPAFGFGWGALAGVLVLCGGLIVPDDPRTDAPDIPAGPERRGTAISRMAWSLNPRTGAAGELITRRVRGILRHRLLRHGLDPDDDAHHEQIDALVGSGLWNRLTGPGTHRKDIERALEAIDRLAPTKEKQ